MIISTLGPNGTFSHEATLEFIKKHKLKSDIVFENTIWEVFDTVKKNKAEFGIVPLENSVGGTVRLALDALFEYKLNIYEELILPIKHNLVANSSIEQIRTLYLHPQTHGQCEKYIRMHMPHVEIIHTSSNGKSAELVSQLNDKTSGTIISLIAAKIYKLKIIDKNVQDNVFNVTRFIIISKKESKRTGSDRTSVAVYPQKDRPGLLHEILGLFAKRKINLSKIESIPSKGKLGDYVFFIEFEGNKADKVVKALFKEIKEKDLLTIFGSYKRKY
jgi:prephenate dehydratase